MSAGMCVHACTKTQTQRKKMGSGGGQHREGDPEIRPQPAPLSRQVISSLYWQRKPLATSVHPALLVKNCPEGTRFGNDQVLTSCLDAELLTLGVQPRVLAQYTQSPRVQGNVRAGPGAAGGPSRVCARAPSAHPMDGRQAGTERVAELHQGCRS